MQNRYENGEKGEGKQEPDTKYIWVQNILIDKYMKEMPKAAFKVYLIILREMNGRDKHTAIPYEKFRKKTGIASQTTIAEALRFLKEKKLIECRTLSEKVILYKAILPLKEEVSI